MENEWIEKMILGVLGFDGHQVVRCVWVKAMEQKDWDGIVNSRMEVGITGRLDGNGFVIPERIIFLSAAGAD